MHNLKFLIFILMGCSSLALALNIGDEAPKATGVNHEGKIINFSEVYNKNKFTLVYFYPKADTPGCTNQAKSLRDEFQNLQKRGVYIIGVSTDKVEDQKQFANKYTIPFDLIADNDKKIVANFQVPTPFGFAKREAFLVHKNKIAWMDENASTTEQSKDVFKALDKLEVKK